MATAPSTCCGAVVVWFMNDAVLSYVRSLALAPASNWISIDSRGRRNADRIGRARRGRRSSVPPRRQFVEELIVGYNAKPSRDVLSNHAPARAETKRTAHTSPPRRRGASANC